LNPFPAFPKVRAPLPEAHQRIYAAHYKENRSGQTTASSMAQRMERWLHTQVAKDLVPGQQASTLELGAGTLNQLEHEAQAGAYDIVEPFSALYADSPLLPRVRNVYADIAEVPADARYDRITSVATFEHICNLPEVVARSALLLAPGGRLRASIPSEGTPLWTLGYMMTTGLEYRLRHGLDYGVLMRHEHVNDAREIEAVLRHFFRDVECSVFGLSRAVSLYQFFACRDPDVKRARDYLDALPAASAA
jgi:SAM-dependent methyltransferase